MPTTIVSLARPASTNRTGTSNAGESVCDHQTRTDRPESDPAIWSRAYEKWEAVGFPAGDGVRFWSEAAQEILEGS
jgi:hypothetical protein